MNRVIKYRAWHNTLGKMIYGHNKFDSMHLCRDGSGNHVYIEKQPISDFMTWGGMCYCDGQLQDLVFQQFTGLKDILRMMLHFSLGRYITMAGTGFTHMKSKILRWLETFLKMSVD